MGRDTFPPQHTQSRTQANIYERWNESNVPGTLRIQAGVVHLFGQYLPGGPTREMGGGVPDRGQSVTRAHACFPLS